MNVKQTALLGLLSAISLILFIIELRMPSISIPGVKLGLANIITVYAVFRFKASETAILVAVRLILGAVFSGNFSALIYSSCGAAACLAGMIILRSSLPENKILLCSIIGAVFHNFGQIIAAILMMGTLSVIGYMPVLIVSGCISGFVTGMTAQIVLNRIGENII